MAARKREPKHEPTPGEVVMSQAWLAGIHGVSELSRRSGIPRATMYQKVANGGWLLSELQALDRVIGFEDEAKIRIVGGER